MQSLQGHVRVDFHYAVHFTSGLFSLANPLLRDVLTNRSDMKEAQLISLDGNTRLDHEDHLNGRRARVLFVVDSEVDKHCRVKSQIEAYFDFHSDELELAGQVLLLPGGEAIKNQPEYVLTIQQAVNDTGLDRHSFIVVVGGGAILDLAGYAAATAHRGIRLIRVPTTTLSQNDSGVGVKNGINFFGKKNFIGTFAPAYAVLDDFEFLRTLPDREWRAGIAEAVKVALIKDVSFFKQIEADAEKLAARDMDAMKSLVRRCAEMHVRHICTSGDAFEMGSSRPLDFGHWSAHKLEQTTNYQLRHGEAVAIGLALDVTYSHLMGWLQEDEAERVLRVLETVGFALYAPDLGAHFDDLDHPDSVFRGLREFREHLGGELTIQMLRALGDGFNVHCVDEPTMMRAIERLKMRHEEAGLEARELKLAA